MTRTAEETDCILLDFAVEPDHDKPTLGRYLAAYPDLTRELVDLALEFWADEFEPSSET